MKSTSKNSIKIPMIRQSLNSISLIIFSQRLTIFASIKNCDAKEY